MKRKYRGKRKKGNEPLYTRVFLEEFGGIMVISVAVPFIPVVAHSAHFLDIFRVGFEILYNVVLIFQDLKSKASRSMPCDVAVHKPGTRVVSFEGNDNKAVAGK